MKVCLSCGQRFETEDWCCPSCNKCPNIVDGFLSFAPDLATENEGFGAGYFEKLFKVEDGSFWFRSRNRLLIWAFQKYFPHAESFFEIGCGTGYVLSGIKREFPNISLYGSDIFNNGLSFAKQRLSDVSLFQIDARRIPFEKEFDVIGIFDVLEHIDEDDVVLRQLFQATKSGGGIILTVPQHRFLWSIVDKYSFHKRRYTRKGLIKNVKDVGFQIVYATSFISFLLPLMLLSRMKRQLSSNKYDALAELEFGRIKNAVLENILTVERLFIKHGFSFPVGGSLLIIARKNNVS
jgi:SAM-dependent methyltransferase